MAFTGDLENLHIVDIIQLIHAARKSGTVSVLGSRGESRIIFSNGHIVAANHLDNSVRIGTVLVKMNAITKEDLEQALDDQKNAAADRKPLMATLMELGKLSIENAAKGLKKLIEITLVELIGWTHGAFTFDTEAIAVSPECSYLPGEMEQKMSLDAQMVLMDALRIFDEQARDRDSGKDITTDDELFEDVISTEEVVESSVKYSTLSAEDLGLADVDRLEKKMPRSFSVEEIFDPLEIHRQRLQEVLSDFSEAEQETFVSFLKQFTAGVSTYKGSSRQKGQGQALILISRDDLIKHSIMTICNHEGIPVFTTDEEQKLDDFIAQCLSNNTAPVLVYDSPEKSEDALPEKTIVLLRQKVNNHYPQLSQIQLVFPLNYAFMLDAYKEGIRAVLPKPLKDARKDTYIEDTIQFLEAFTSYLKVLLNEQKDIPISDNISR